MTPLLDTIQHPHDIQAWPLPKLLELSDELRERIITVLSKTGGHLSSNLGVIELTIALHTVFNSPKDALIFDVGHQTYVHKLLTGRNIQFPSIRQTQGLSGFSCPSESPHDLFYSGHAGNTLSLALGVAKQRDLKDKTHHIVPILGDAALTCGLTLEGLNNIPNHLSRFPIILNDNAMSISKNIGTIPKLLESGQHPSTSKQFFEQFGLSYIGPIDGHDLPTLITTFQSQLHQDTPTLIHVQTIKGKGMTSATKNPTSYHGAKPFNLKTGSFLPSSPNTLTFPKIFGSHLLKMANYDPDICTITPAMPVGSYLSELFKKHPSRCIDVGIAEGHCLTYAGGMAAANTLKVVACVYSSFLQRALDNIYHDICVQNTQLLIAIDRAGLATGDGVTAQGIFDIAYLNAFPNLLIAQPRNGDVLEDLMHSAFNYQSPIAIRYPNHPTSLTHISAIERLCGKGELLRAGNDIVIIALGHMYTTALQAADQLQSHGLTTCVIDPIFLKPLDTELLSTHIKHAHMVITIEEHAKHGGLGSIINQFMMNHQLGHIPSKNLALPDHLIEHGSYDYLIDKYQLTQSAIVDAALATMNLI